MGDIASLMPAIHPNCNGASGTSHGSNYQITDPETACVDSAKMQLQALVLLLQPVLHPARVGRGARREAERSAERAPRDRCLQALGVGMHVGTAPRAASPGVRDHRPRGGRGILVRDDPQQCGLLGSTTTSDAGAHRLTPGLCGR